MVFSTIVFCHFICPWNLCIKGCLLGILFKEFLCPYQVNLVEWLKMMVGHRRAEEVVDPNLDVKPTTRAFKRALLVALRCVDPDSEKRPKMSQVVRMLESDEFPYREVLFHFQLSNTLLMVHVSVFYLCRLSSTIYADLFSCVLKSPLEEC